MIRMLMWFVLFTAIFWFGITSFRALKKRQKWSLFKTVSFSVVCSILSLTFLITIVILF
jgi:hypothetical protein